MIDYEELVWRLTDLRSLLLSAGPHAMKFVDTVDDAIAELQARGPRNIMASGSFESRLDGLSPEVRRQFLDGAWKTES